ncbi:hypothetical protein [Myceligenerans xiligouense]|uniref:Uncharacterized protein n=1 Tax=Myceligenerans xiligouense TaxID=253184 RepID=A0A3N4YSQ8_9MICO|nr:hypothetical protein [Myceligenerans xiligouense]RPF21610.1 hypothetical protein EDD34_2241 [Myceligenerans xiligouense]
MSARTTHRPNFDGHVAHAAILHDAVDEPVTGRSVVVNLGMTDAFTEGTQRSPLPPLSSTVVTGGTVTGDLVMAITPGEGEDLGARARERGWEDFYGGDGPVLLKSPQDTAGTVMLDRAAVLHQDELARGAERHTVKVNLWFSPAGTDCGIHNLHPFIEVHTQVAGYGRMQKFASKDHASLYEDQQLSPGATNPVPFCLERDGELVYPWHQYRADTDCVWLAVEYHEARTA